MKIAAIIPTRGDRPEFLNFAMFQLSRQSLQPDFIEVVNDPPTDHNKDITKRYRLGTERAFTKGADVAFLIEDDDFYDKEYIKEMSSSWESFGRPSIFGIGETYYYHLSVKTLFHTKHPERASAFCTMVDRTILNMRWPADKEPFTDVHMWRNMKGKTWIPPRILALGIKHSLGKTGGIGHDKNWMMRHRKVDENWLKQVVDEEAFQFYKKIEENIR